MLFRAAEFAEALRMALFAITAHKLRSALTLLGVLVGVFSIIVTMTALRVLQANVESELGQLGANTFQIQKWPGLWLGGDEGFEKYWRRPNLTLQLGQTLQERATLAAAVGIEEDFWSGEATSRYGKTPPGVTLFGETPGSFPAKNWIVAEGRALLEGDVDSARDVCILGSALATTLFPFGSPLGERVKFDGIGYLVVGVLEKKGAQLGGQQDNFAIIPLTTALNRYGRAWRSLVYLVQAPDAASFDDTVEQVRGILRAIRKVPPGNPDDFELFSNDSLISQFDNFTKMVRIGVAVVAGMALLAAGVGIMNIMLVSVTERTREIGVRRAIGAKKRHIMTQFLFEAVVLCQLGGIAGVVLGILGGNLTAVVLKLPPRLPLDWVAIGLAVCSLVGIFFGAYPAWKAANLDPVDSLRYE